MHMNHGRGGAALAIVISALVLPALLTGCGSSGPSTYSVEADTTVTVAKIPTASYVPRINRICRKAWGVILANFAKYSRGQDPRAPRRERFAEAVRLSLAAGIVFHIFDEIYDLGAPFGRARDVEGIIGTMQSASERAEKGLAPVSDVAKVTELYDEYNQRAHRYGLDECLVDEARLRPLER